MRRVLREKRLKRLPSEDVASCGQGAEGCAVVRRQAGDESGPLGLGIRQLQEILTGQFQRGFYRF